MGKTYSCCSKPPFHDIHEECGIFGVFGHPEAANLAYLAFTPSSIGQEALAYALATEKLFTSKSQWALFPISSTKKA